MKHALPSLKFTRQRWPLIPPRKLGELLLCLVHHTIRLVPHIYGLALLLICLCKLLCVVHHAVDLVIRQGTRSRDLDVGLLVRSLVEGLHGKDAVGINVKLHFNLWDPPWRRWDAV